MYIILMIDSILFPSADYTERAEMNTSILPHTLISE